MNKYEKLIEYIVNEQEDKARELFHDIVVEKSRDIYESLLSQETTEEIGGDQVEDLVDEITSDEEGISEDDLDIESDAEVSADDADADMDMDLDMEVDSDEGSDGEMGEEGEELEDRVMDLEDALDELKAEFDKLMGEMGEEGEVSTEESAEPMIEGEKAEEVKEGDAEEVKEGDEELNKLREYVEKVAAPKGGADDNAKSVVASKNDMGGKSVDVTSGGEEKGAKAKVSGEFTGEFQNKPGAGAKLEKAPAAKTAE